jgi:signal transduction histidine kinase
MLHFSRRSESGIEPVDVATLLDRVLELAGTDYDMKKKYKFQQIELQRQYAPDLPPVPIVLAEMEQALLNIIKNAAQAMSGAAMVSQPCIIVRIRVSGDVIAIDIEDNGPGMAEAVRRRIFEPFFSTKAVGVGSGLGLSVAYAIVTKGHGGSIEVTSSPGEGSCFTVKLPLQGRKL